MSPPTPTSLRSSPAFDPLVLEPRPSRWLIVWWLAVHVTAAVAVAALERGLPLTAAGVAVVVWHGWRRRPPAPPLIRRGADGRWSVPARGIAAGDLAPGTSCHPHWVRLVLRDGARPRRRMTSVLLLRDQFDLDGWRALQATLRRRATQGRGEPSGDFS